VSGTLAGLFDLTGRVAIVTGGSRGLGVQIASALGEFGASAQFGSASSLRHHANVNG